MALPAYPNSLSLKDAHAQFGNTTPPYSLSNLYSTKVRQTVNISWLTNGFGVFRSCTIYASRS